MKTVDSYGCLGNTIALRSGVYFDFDNPRAEMINISDIGWALSNVCRYGGHCSFYSVAEHCCYCYDQIEPRRNLRIAALLHDASEAYVGDMPKPLKNLLPEYSVIEKKIQRLIYVKFGVDGRYDQMIKKVDRELLKAEKAVLFPRDREVWAGFEDVDEIDVEINFWEPAEAFKQFMRRCDILGIS